MRQSAALMGCILLLTGSISAQWIRQESGTTERFRGVSAAGFGIAWASGNHGTILRTSDGGLSWKRISIPDTDSLDFRDIDAVNPSSAFALSIGPGDKSRVYKTTDGGSHWQASYINRDPRGFLDAMSFWNESSGLVVGDGVDGKLTILRTTNSGSSWEQIDPKALPPALPDEGAFAASGTNIALEGTSNAWIGTGVNCARVYRSTDRGKTWAAFDTPITKTSNSTGVFSVYFSDANNGVVTGGDYRNVGEAAATAAYSTDGGKSWNLSSALPGGLRSCVCKVKSLAFEGLVAVGPAGSDYSLDAGKTWVPLDTTGFHAVSFSRDGSEGWAVGEKGIIARWSGLSLLPK